MSPMMDVLLEAFGDLLSTVISSFLAPLLTALTSLLTFGNAST